MKKIVFVINVDWYFNLHWLDRALFFKRNGYHVYIISDFKTSGLIDKMSGFGFHCTSIPMARSSINIFFELGYIVSLFSALKEIKPDLIHAVTIKPNIYSGLINKFFLNQPIVYSITGLGAVFSSKKNKFYFLKKIVVSLYNIISLPNCRFIFENGEDLETFTHLGILNHNGITIKGAGIDLTRFSPSLPPGKKIVLFAARLLKDKGLSCLIEAKQLLESRGIVFTLNVAGIIDDDVSSAIPLKQVEYWAKNGDINWLGNIKDMPTLIKESDIVCLPTTYGEGVPRILIEAASCQRAIITTDVVGCREIVSHNINGLLAQPGNVVSLANCLDYLLDNDKKALEFGLQGRKKVEQEFSQEIVFEKTLQVYHELLGE
ncbi:MULTISPECIES: glycosyltransferase family 4 protein [Vibrio]|uniref:glycosyltransferase family 4 protein n=1 Tax=Vibrio TaxID=662 RepID=UPI00215C59DE|nr:glycosyltransferase family 4 protein [Vibrio sp. RM-69-4]MCR9421154.1 glycosyltransferase family 4 protein [Vibrio sp. RM-69-4]